MAEDNQRFGEDLREQFPPAPDSLWLDTYGPYTPSAPLQKGAGVDVVIIGGGFTGLATAYELLRAEPALEVAVLEAQQVGYGASGRNGSFAMTVVGLGFGVTAMLHGRDFLQHAHRYMMQAVETLDELISREGLDCDRIRPGFLRVATTPAYVQRLLHDIGLMNELGFDDIYWLDARETRARINSPHYLGAMWEPRLLLINPLKLVRAEKALVERLGGTVYEETPVLTVTRMVENGTPTSRRFRLETAQGTVHARKVVFATNGYSHLFPQLQRKQIPAFTYMVATEPLSDRQLATLGWEGREGVEDARNLIHYYRLTPDRRLVMGGGPVGLTLANSLRGDKDQNAWRHLEEQIRFLFPGLSDVRISHRWGGPFSVTLDLTPALGYIGGPDAVYSLGCIGHGVSMSHLNAQVLRDLVLERKSELVENPFVNRQVLPWPPEPLRIMAAGALRGYLRVEDWYHERTLV